MKGKGKNMSDQEKFEKSMAAMQKQLPQTYFEQFKKPDYAKIDKKVKERENARQGTSTYVMKGTSNKHEPKLNIGKLLDPEAEIKIKEVPKEISLQVMQAREEAKLSQEQLAKLVEVKFNQIRDLEAGHGTYEPDVVVKIEKALKKTFTRSWKKQN